MPGSGVPRAAAPLSQSPQKWEIISKISERTLVVVDVDMDQRYYARLNSSNRSFNPSLENKTYILLAPPPVHRNRTLPLKSEDPLPQLSSSEDSPSREEEVLEKAPTTPPPYRLKLYLSQTPEEELDS